MIESTAPTRLALLACPVDHLPLHPAPPDVVATLNAAIGKRALRDASGSLVQDTIDSGLLRSNGRWLYPVRDGVAVLLPEAAILVR